ncbi:glycosyltransferase family 2 protein [Limosilactobacillus panis]|uniref:glycosyltransferase family 2 protein n=1 Tax=Limosilactobacillus panis TaxID=47493 RepID=UPI001C98531C|nr:glycosyltransferase family 2 protein [Limosilactobacillus panis]QZN92587.1 glycosyltransferase family 2 protein [Limosilactobacillus panis]
MSEEMYIIIPAYNEAANIARLIKDWYPVIERHSGDGHSRLVIINDGSKDNTYELIKEAEKQYPLLEGLTKANGGHGSAVLYGYRYAIKNNADYVFQTDSDNQTNPAEFEQFWQLRKKYDAVIGNRVHRQDGIQRIMVEKTLLMILRFYYGVKIPDSNAPYRLMKVELLKKYISKMPSDFNLPNVMLTTYFAYYHEKIKFLPISFVARQEGTNSINIPKITKIGWKALGDFRMLKKQMND